MSLLHRLGLIAGVLLLPLLAGATESAKSSDEDSLYVADALAAQGLLRKAVAYYQQEGEKALAVFSRQGPFVIDSLYVFVINTDGVILASGGPSIMLVGRDITSAMPDTVRARFLQPIEEGRIHEVEYAYYDWSLVRGKVDKHIFFQRLGNRILAVGYYEPRAEASQAPILLELAVEAVKRNPQETFAAINALDQHFYQDDLYVYVVDLDSKRFVAHGANIRMLGREFVSLHDPEGKLIGQPIFDLAVQKGSGEFDYMWPNPVTGKNEPKRALIQRVGNYLVAVGYYLPR